MRYRAGFVAVTAAALMAGGFSAALAQATTPPSTTTSPPTTTTPTAPTPTAPTPTAPTTTTPPRPGPGHCPLTLVPGSGRPGDRIRVETYYGLKVTSVKGPVLIDGTTGSGEPLTGVVRDVPPGTYTEVVDCIHQGTPEYDVGTATFTVLGPKTTPPTSTRPPAGQVTKVPSGAPQTGGGGTA